MITVAGLHKTFEGATVLKGIDINIEQGQSLVLIGASGSGKSVLLKCILGLERHSVSVKENEDCIEVRATKNLSSLHSYKI